MIYQHIDFNSFQNAFDRYGRSAQFSAKGLELLFNYIEELSNDMGEGMELDVIGLCCQYSDYTLDDFLDDYNIDGIDSTEELEQALIDGTIDCVMAYDIDNDVILVNNDY